jgi:hypothetical protein
MTPASIIDTSGSISFGDENLATSGQVSGTTVKATTGLYVGAQQVVSIRQAAVADVSGSFDPGDGVIGSLTSSATTSQAEYNALRDETEKLRDFCNDMKTQVNQLLSRLRAHGLLET